jgi:hypothetical protein
LNKNKIGELPILPNYLRGGKAKEKEKIVKKDERYKICPLLKREYMLSSE